MEDLESLKQLITITVAKYDVNLSETHLQVWQGDKNEMILKRFLAAKMSSGASRRTLNYYKDTLSRGLTVIGKPYDEITSDDIRLYLASRMMVDKVSKCTANNERRNLSAFYTWLQNEEILLKNPMKRVDVIKATKIKKKAFTSIELEKIRASCRTARERAIIEFLISTWCRVSEVDQVKISDINGNKVVVHGKGDKYREVYLNARAMLAVDTYLKERKDDSPLLFPGCTVQALGRKFHEPLKKKKLKTWEWYKVPELVSSTVTPDPGRMIEALVRKIGQKAGVENTHPHRFRRTGATMALRQGMSILTVSKLLGHESIETTQIYLDISDEELEQAHKKFVV